MKNDDIANKVPYSEKQVIRVVRNLFKQGKLTRIKKQITSGRPIYLHGHSTKWIWLCGVKVKLKNNDKVIFNFKI